MSLLLPFFVKRVPALIRESYPIFSSTLAGEFHFQLIKHSTHAQNKQLKKRLKLSSTALSVCIALIGMGQAQAAPSGGAVVGGTGTITQDTLSTIINQTSQNMAIDWDSYNIDANEVVKYIQPNSQSISLNRILGVNGSTIAGTIESNGVVILINPNGLVFTETSVLNVGGIIASGLDMSSDDFMNGDYIFNEVVDTEGTVVNKGIINASLGGNVALIGKQVENSGLIEANLGTVTLAAGKQAVLTFDSAGLLGVRISEAILQDEIGVDPAVLNSGEINAAGGRVLLTASTSQDIFSQAVNAGIDEATSVVVNEDGTFTLGDGADVENSGSIDVSSSDDSQSAGKIVLLGDNVTSSGNILADSSSGDGGSIELHATDTTTLTGSSVTSARSESGGSGGDIKILGDNVGLLGQSSVDVSGDEGGGQVLIGGDYQGDNIQIRSASGTYVGEAVTISADALTTGDGGEIIVWADDSTKVYGTISATGGVESGDGGFVETSAAVVDLDLSVDVSATNGQSGEWLIDPENVYIVDTAEEADEDSIYTATVGYSNITIATIKESLASGTDITIEATSSSSDSDVVDGSDGSGNITLLTDLEIDNEEENTSTLTLKATNDINLLADITLTNSNLVLNADADSNGSGDVNTGVDSDIADGNDASTSDISTEGGDVTISGVSITVDSINTTGGTDTAGGAILLTASNGGINIEGDLTSDGGVASDYSRGKNAGAITLQATSGAISVVGNISAMGSTGGDINGGLLNLDGGDGGEIQLTTLNSGNIEVSGAINSSGGDSSGGGDSSDNTSGGNGGIVDINSATGISVKSITTSGGSGTGNIYVTGGNAGSITLTAAENSLITLAGDLIAIGGDDLEDKVLGDGGAITITGATTIDGSVTLDATGETDGEVSFSSTIDATASSDSLVINGGTVDVLDAIGATTALDSLTINATADVAVDAINTTNVATITVTSDENRTLNLNGEIAGSLTLTGAGEGVHTLAAADITNTWLISDSNSGTLNDATFDGFANLVGGSADDDFTLSSAAASVTSVDGGGGSDSLQGWNIANIWDITGDNEGTLNTDISFSNIAELIGGSGDDDFTLSSATASVISIDGGSAGSDSLQGWNRINEWNITGDNEGTLNTDISFSNVAELIGGSADDDFTLSSTTASVTSIDGGSAGSDSLQGWNIANVWDITGDNEGTLNTDISFSNISELIGGNADDDFTLSSATASVTSVDGGSAGSDSLQGWNIANVWDITGDNEGTLNTDISFSNISELIGGSADDDFILSSATASVTSVDGGSGGSDSLQGWNAINEWNITANNEGTLNSDISFSNIAKLIGGSADDSFRLASFDNIGFIDGGGESSQDSVILTSDVDQTIIVGSDATDIESYTASGTGVYTLQGADSTNSWVVTGTDKGTLNSDISFENFTNLVGGSADDSFTLASFDDIGFIDGGEESSEDSVTLTSNADQTVVIGTDAYDIESYTASGTGVYTLQGAESDNTWIITAANAGTLNSDISFTNFTNLVGGSLDDSFSLTSFYYIGSIDGGGETSEDSVTLTGNSKTIIVGTDAVNIESYVATGSNSVLQGANTDNTWEVTATNTGTLNGDNFTGFANLVGGSADDSFSLASFDDIGSIDGGEETTSDSVTLTSTTDQTIIVGSDATNIESYTASGTGVYTLQGAESDNTWIITAANAGTLNSDISFKNFTNLVGGSLDDDFTLASFDDIGSIDGGGEASEDSVTLTSNVNQTVIIGTDATDIESYTASGTGVYTLQGAESDNTWIITAANAGTLNSDISFTNFTNLVGGSLDDDFTLASFDDIGSIDGGGETSEDSVTLTSNVNQTVLIGTDATDIESYTASGTGVYTLQGAESDNTWIITAANAGTLNSDISFENFTNLVGGSLDDDFTLASFDDIGSIDGGGETSEDSVTLTGDNQTLIVDSDVLNIESYIATGSNSVLQGANADNTWEVTATNTGTLNGDNFTGFANLVGGSLDDDFTLASFDDIGSIDGGDETSEDSVTLTSNADQTVVIGTDATDIESYTASGTGVYTLQGANSDNSWLVTASNSGTLNSDISFENFTNLVGGSADDSFSLASFDYIGFIDGGAEGDTGDSVTLTSTTDQTIIVGSDATNIESYTASSTGTNTLQGEDTDNSWVVTGSNKGTLNSDISFENFANLVGGSADDSFTLASFDYIGFIDGGEQSSSDSVTLTSTADQTIVVGSDATNIESYTASGTGTHTLQGANTDNTWEVTGSNTGTLNSDISFENFANLTGGSGVDNFNIVNMSQISGLIDGGDGADYLTLTGNDQTVDLESDVSQIENINTTGDNNSLIATDNYNRWNIDGDNSGSITDDSGTITFSGFSDLTGGSYVDVFTIALNGNISGLIDGAGGSDSLISYSEDITTFELGDDVTDNLNINNIESIEANNDSTNTLLADNVSNVWVVDGDRSGTITYSGITTSFSNFDLLTGGSDVDKFSVSGGDVTTISMGDGDDSITLSSGDVDTVLGGKGDDSFIVSADIADTLEGGDGTDEVIYTMDNVTVNVGSDIVSFEKVSAQKGNGTINAADDVTTTWEITDENKGVVTDSSDLFSLAFSGFSTINGGSGVDYFTITKNGSITGIINGAGGDDVLNVSLDDSRSDSASINFNGGDGDDVVNITSTNTTLSESYTPNVSIDSSQFDQLSFSNSSSDVDVAINFQNVSSVNDSIETVSLLLNTGTSSDTLYLSSGLFSADSGSVEVSFASLNKGDITVDADSGKLVFTNSVDVDGDLTITAAEVTQDAGEISAERLVLNNVTAMGVDDDAIETNIDELLIAEHSGEIYLNQSGSLILTQLSDSTGSVDINVSGGSISATNALSSSGDLTLAATAINLLNGNNNLTGNIDLSADDIVLNNDAITRLVGLTTQNVAVTSTGSILTDGELILTSSDGDGVATFTSSQGDVTFDGNTTADTLIINANNDVLLNGITAQTLTVNATVGDISGDEDVSVSGIANLYASTGDISFVGSNIDFNEIVLTANNATITDVDDISIDNSKLTNSLTLNSNGEMQLGSISAGSSLYFDAGSGAIVSNDSDLSAPEMTFYASAGIGNGSYNNLIGESGDNSGAINISTDLLKVINNGSGMINMENEGDITITDLRNNGDIVFTNSGDILLQVTTNSSTGESQGAIDANYGGSIFDSLYSGSVALLTQGTNSIYTSGTGTSEIDIIAENLVVNQVTSFGTLFQPIRLRVNNDFTIIGSIASVYYYGGEPASITKSEDLSLQVINDISSLSSQQLIELESLGSIDPAIFTDVRNYDVDEVSVLLPQDQRLDSDEDDDDDDDDESEKEKSEEVADENENENYNDEYSKYSFVF